MKTEEKNCRNIVITSPHFCRKVLFVLDTVTLHCHPSNPDFICPLLKMRHTQLMNASSHILFLCHLQPVLADSGQSQPCRVFILASDCFAVSRRFITHTGCITAHFESGAVSNDVTVHVVC